jgi:hypothetical protein
MPRCGDACERNPFIYKTLSTRVETLGISCFDNGMSFLSILDVPLARKLTPKAAQARLATTDQPQNREVS